MSRELRASHTPGPWQYDNIGAEGDIYIETAAGSLRAIVPANDALTQITEGEREANARLIAAAPALLAACKAALTRLPKLGVSYAWPEFDALSGAIAKAEGREL